VSIRAFLVCLNRRVIVLRSVTAGVLGLVRMVTIANDAGPGLVSEKKQKHKPTRQHPRSGPDECDSNLRFLPRQFLFLLNFPCITLMFARVKTNYLRHAWL